MTATSPQAPIGAGPCQRPPPRPTHAFSEGRKQLLALLEKSPCPAACRFQQRSGWTLIQVKGVRNCPAGNIVARGVPSAPRAASPPAPSARSRQGKEGWGEVGGTGYHHHQAAPWRPSVSPGVTLTCTAAVKINDFASSSFGDGFPPS